MKPIRTRLARHSTVESLVKCAARACADAGASLDETDEIGQAIFAEIFLHLHEACLRMEWTSQGRPGLDTGELEALVDRMSDASE